MGLLTKRRFVYLMFDFKPYLLTLIKVSSAQDFFVNEIEINRMKSELAINKMYFMTGTGNAKKYKNNRPTISLDTNIVDSTLRREQPDHQLHRAV